MPNQSLPEKDNQQYRRIPNDLPIHAKQLFEKGDRVKPSSKGLEQLGMKKDRRGTVAGFSRDGQSLWVLSATAKVPTCYHHTFWEKA